MLKLKARGARYHVEGKNSMGVKVKRHSIGIDVYGHDGKPDKIALKAAQAKVLEMERYTSWPPKPEEPKGTPLVDAYEKWLAQYQKESGTWKLNRDVERLLIRPLALQGVTLVEQVTAEHLNALQLAWKAENDGKRRLNTIKTRRKITSCMLNYCVNFHNLPKNPWKAVKPLKEIKPTKEQIMAGKRQDKGVATLPLDRKGNASWLLIQANVPAFVRGELEGQTKFQANPLLHHPATFLALLWLMYETGLRRSDAVIFRPDQIQSTPHGGAYTCAQIKTGGDVTVFLPQPLIDVLRTLPLLPWRGTAAAYTAITDMPFQPGAAIFPFYDGAHSTYENYMECNLNLPLRELGVLLFGAHAPSLRPHRFRDSFAVNMLSMGLALQDLQLMLGHCYLSTTEKYYRPYVLDIQEAVERRQVAARQAALYAEAQAAKTSPVDLTLALTGEHVSVN